MVFPGVTMGRNVSIGANSVIDKDIADNLVVVGNPARLVKRKPPLPDS